MNKLFDNELRLIMLTMTLLCTLSSNAQDRVKSKLRNVTVYTSGAMLMHEANVPLRKGNQVIQIAGVSNNIDASSIIVSLPNQSMLLSVSPKTVNVQKTNLNTSERRLVDSFETVTELKKKIEYEMSTENFAIGLIKKNDQIFSSKENTTDDVIKAYAEYKKLINASQANLQRDQLRLNEVKKTLKSLKEKINEQNLWTKNETVVEILVQNEATINKNINLSYYTPEAKWVPSYLISNEDAQPMISIDYKAIVRQNTGFDWKSVDLSISTGNPQKSSLQPTISTWFLRYYTPQRDYYSMASNSGKTIRANNYEMNAAKEDEKSKKVSVSTQDLVTTSVFDIETPYDVVTGNVPVLAKLKRYNVPALVYFYCVPKLDKDVYLLAAFSFDEASELIPGEALIMNSGDYVGKTVLDPYAISDTLRLSLGRTPVVQVKREMIKSSCKTNTFGGKTTTTRYYDFKTYNGLKRKIRLIVKDQIPISTDKAMTVELLEKADGVKDENSGIITWDYDLSPNASRSFQFGFEVKHPKDKSIQGL